MKTMEKRIVNPWTWQNERSYSQAVEVKNVESTLYCSGQAAIDPEGISSDKDMKSQLEQAIANLEEVISRAGYECRGIVRLNVYTTSAAELWPYFPILQEWIARNQVEQSLTMLEVNGLFETLKIELEATVVR